MKFREPLREGRFVRRYKRFFVDIDKDGETLVAHCPNTGSMKGCKDEGALCRYSTSDDPKRKLKYTLEMIHSPGGWVGVNTGWPNKLVYELWQNQPLPHWQGMDRGQSEVKINDQSRLDMALWSSQDHDINKWKPKSVAPPCHLIEIKNVTMTDAKGGALFPDAVTTRGLKHLRELMELQEKGFSTEMVYVVQRQDCRWFSPAEDIDPEYARLLGEAQRLGMRITALQTVMTPSELFLNGETLEIRL